MKRMKHQGFILKFKRLVSALSDSYRDQLKTHNRQVIGAHDEPKTLGTYGVLRRFKKVLVVILGCVRNDGVRNGRPCLHCKITGGTLVWSFGVHPTRRKVYLQPTQ